jgi:hypothetical protein
VDLWSARAAVIFLGSVFTVSACAGAPFSFKRQKPDAGDGGNQGSGGLSSAGAGGTTDLNRDSTHCGRCGHGCGGGKCQDGVCQRWVVASGPTVGRVQIASDGAYLVWTDDVVGVSLIPVSGIANGAVPRTLIFWMDAVVNPDFSTRFSILRSSFPLRNWDAVVGGQVGSDVVGCMTADNTYVYFSTSNTPGTPGVPIMPPTYIASIAKTNGTNGTTGTPKTLYETDATIVTIISVGAALYWAERTPGTDQQLTIYGQVFI